MAGGHRSRRSPGGDAPVTRNAFLAAWNDLTKSAKRSQCDRIVQREAIGLWRHEEVEGHHPISTILFFLTSTDGEEAL